MGSSTSDTSTLTANNNNLAGDGAGVWNLQTSGSVDATLNWWGSTSGPTTSANPGGTGAASAGNVDFSPWLGDANLEPYDYLVFSTTAGDNYFVTPIEWQYRAGCHLGHIPWASIHPYGLSLATIPGGDTLGFAGNGGTITINGETGSINDDFVVTDTSVQFNAVDGLNGTTINFIGTGMTRNVQAKGLDQLLRYRGRRRQRTIRRRWRATPARTHSFFVMSATARATPGQHPRRRFEHAGLF